MEENNSVFYFVDYGEVVVDITKMMKKRNLSKTQLIKKSGIHHLTINKYINQTIVQLDKDVLARLCYVLQCDLSDILTYKKHKNGKN